MPPELQTDSIAEGFRQGADGGWALILPLLLILTLTALLLLTVRFLVKAYHQKRRHLILFDELSDHHRLNRGQRKFLHAAAKSGGLASIEEIFVRPSTFDSYVRRIGAGSDWIGPLREQLYGYPPVPEEPDTRVIRRLVNIPEDPPPPAADEPTDVLDAVDDAETRDLTDEQE